MSTALMQSNFVRRLFLYSNERFPVLSYGLMSVLFAAAGLSISSALRSGAGFSFSAMLCAGLTTVALFFQLRVADEHKDHEEDCRYQSERPVPRGLIGLGELRNLAIGLAVLQLAVCALFGSATLLCLLITWIYFALMAKEFFVPSFLRAHPFIYMLSHLFILVFSDLLITSFDFKAGISPFLAFFYAASFMNGMVIEVGRKIRHPNSEREGVETYSKLLGGRKAAALMSAALLVAQLLILEALSCVPGASHLLWGLFPAQPALVFLVFDFSIFLIASAAIDSQTVGKVFGAVSNLSVMVSYITVLIFARCI